MKNLKKVLSLALAFAMVLGLCVGAMAADTKTQDVTKLADWADVTHKDAAQLLNAFNIMAGDDRGFRPSDNVTRAEAAKMIVVALWGGDQLEDLFKDSYTTFTDVHSTDWFASYVKYAATTGVVGGRNATTFDPKGNVTGYELLKMALTALGYKQDTEGLIGANWTSNTMYLAYKNDLTADVDITNWNLPINREDTAQVISNMIGAKIVSYDKDGNLYATNDDTKSFGTEYLKLETIPGILVANTYGAMIKSGATKYTVKDADANSDPEKFNSVVSYTVKENDKDVEKTIAVNSNSGLFDLGAKVTVYKKGKTVISTVVTPSAAISDTTKYDTTPGTTEKAVKNITIGATTDNTVYSADFNLDTNANGKYDLTITVHFAAIKDVNAVVETENFGTVYQTGATAWRDLYEDDKELRNGFTTMKTIAGAAPAKGDKIMYVTNTNAAGTSVTFGVALESVEGKVTRVNSDQTKYTIEGAEYSVGTKKTATATTEKCVGIGFGTSAVFYTYPGSTVIVKTGKVETEAAKVALLYDAGYVPGTEGTALDAAATKPVVEVAAILSDGTPGTYVLASVPNTTTTNYDLTKEADIAAVFGNAVSNTPAGKLNGLNSKDWSIKVDNSTTATATGADKNYIVEYTLTDDGYMAVTAIETFENDNVITGDSNNGTAITTSTTSVKVNGADKVITPNTVTFIQTSKKTSTDAEKWAAYVGRTASYTIDKSDTVSVVLTDYASSKDAAAIKYALVEYDDVDHSAGTKSDFYYIIAANGQIDTKKFEYVVYDASADAVKTVTTEKDTATVGEEEVKIAKGDFYTTYDSKAFSGKLDYAKDTSDAIKGYVTSFKDSILVITGYNNMATDSKYPLDKANTIVVDNDTKYYFLGDDKTSEKITADDVVAQVPSKEPTVDTTDSKLSVPYQAIVIKSTAAAKSGVAATVIVFEAEQSYKTTNGIGR